MIGVKDLIAELKEPFDRQAKAVKKAKKNMSERGESSRNKEALAEETELVLAEWDRKTKRGEDYQNKLCEKELLNNSNAVLDGYKIYEGDSKPERSILENNVVYLEKQLYSRKYDVIGYADRIEVKRGAINITDNKVVEKIYRTGSFKTDNGFTVKATKMSSPLHDLDDCNYHDFVLQLSLYMYIAWENNKTLKIGKLYIRHIIMNDNDKVTSDELIEVPYMKEEVIKMLKYKKLND